MQHKTYTMIKATWDPYLKQFDLTIESVLPSHVMAAPRNMKMAVIVMKTVWHAYELHVKILRTCRGKTS